MAAPFYWAVLFSVHRPAVDIFWPLGAPAAFLMPALVYPVLEEIVFRGAAQGMLWKTRLAAVALGPFSGPNIVTSIAFAGFHVLLQPSFVTIAVIVPSLVFGYFRDRYRGIVPPILLHVFYNAGLFLLFMQP